MSLSLLRHFVLSLSILSLQHILHRQIQRSEVHTGRLQRRSSPATKGRNLPRGSGPRSAPRLMPSKVPQQVLDSVPFFKLVCASRASKTKNLLLKTTESQLTSILLVILNIYNGFIPITSPNQRRVVLRRKGFIQKLLSRASGLKGKKKLLLQNFSDVRVLLCVFLQHE